MRQDESLPGRASRDESGRAKHEGGVRVALQRVVLAVPVVMFALWGWAHRWMYDDGFIYLRVVRQLVAGNGPVFNQGQRVEAFTGPLWVAILAIADLVTPFRLEWIAVVLGIALSAGGAGFAMAGSARLARVVEPSAFLLPLGVWVPLAIAATWMFESSGLEGGLTYMWIGLCLWILAAWARAPDKKTPAWAAIVLGLGWLIRPELLVDSLLFGALIVMFEFPHISWRARVRFLALIGGPALAYQIFRMGYYGSFVANTAIAKEGLRTRWSLGWRYLADFTNPYWLWLPVLVLALAVFTPLLVGLERRGARRATAVVAGFVAAAVINAAYVVAIGGDYLHARLLLPALFTFCAPVMLVPATKRFVASFAIVPWALVCGVTLRPVEMNPNVNAQFSAGRPFIVLPPNPYGIVTTTQRGWGPGGRSRQWYTGRALYFPNGFSYRRIDLPTQPDLRLPTVAAWAVGINSYALGTGVDIFDLLGLADPLTSHLQLVHRGIPGHEKPLPEPWIVARLIADGTNPPQQVFAETGDATGTTLIPSMDNAQFRAQVQWARAALQCSPIADLEAAADRPLTVGRFFSNLIHSVARTRLRIPQNPQQAYEKFCHHTTESASIRTSLRWSSHEPTSSADSTRRRVDEPNASTHSLSYGAGATESEPTVATATRGRSRAPPRASRRLIGTVGLGVDPIHVRQAGFLEIRGCLNHPHPKETRGVAR